MKWFRVVMRTGILCFLFSKGSHAQSDDSTIKTKSIAPYRIAITYSKTSNLIFPYAIKSVDRGSASVMVQKAKGVENILQIKAASPNFEQTNLSVVTSDGQFYSFLIDYSIQPYTLNLSFFKDTLRETQNVLLMDAPLNEETLQILTAKVQSEENFIHRSVNQQKMRLSLRSIYLAGGIMWHKLQIQNKSLIDYSPESIRFFLREKKRTKRTAMQETELQPLYMKPLQNIQGNQSTDFVAAFMPFTIPKTQELIIQVDEQGGGRPIMLRISHRIILKAKLLELKNSIR